MVGHINGVARRVVGNVGSLGRKDACRLAGSSALNEWHKLVLNSIETIHENPKVNSQCRSSLYLDDRTPFFTIIGWGRFRDMLSIIRIALPGPIPEHPPREKRITPPSNFIWKILGCFPDVAVEKFSIRHMVRSTSP